MTRPGDPGHAAASREGARTHDTEQVPGSDAARRRRPWTLHRRLLVIVAVLLVAVSAVVGVVSVAVFHGSSVARLDANLATRRARARTWRSPASRRDSPAIPTTRRALVLNIPGQEPARSPGSSAATAPRGRVHHRGRRVLDLPPNVGDALAAVPRRRRAALDRRAAVRRVPRDRDHRSPSGATSSCSPCRSPR